MARIDDLIGLVDDAALRREMQSATTELRRHRRFGLVFEQGNSLRTCVNRAIDRLWRNGTIKTLQRRWLARVGGARELK